jgi:hypothetical protein
MLKLSWIELFIRIIPEGLIIILAGYAFSKKTINIKLYLLSSIILALLTFGFRSLPISAGLPMVLSATCAVVLLVIINKIIIGKAILSTMICALLSIIAEGANVLLLGEVFNLDINKILVTSGPVVKTLYGLPSLVLFGLIVVTYYFIVMKRKKV